MPGAYPLTIEIPTGPEKIPPVKVLTNWLIFIPQFIWLYILSIVAFLAAIVCWFSIVFTGSAPESLSVFIAGVIRYQWRVITGLFEWAEPYPPFAPIPQGFADPGGYPAELNVTPVSGDRNRVTVLVRIILCHSAGHCVVPPQHRQRHLPSHFVVHRPVHRAMEPVTEDFLHWRVPVATSGELLLFAVARRVSAVQPGALGTNGLRSERLESARVAERARSAMRSGGETTP